MPQLKKSGNVFNLGAEAAFDKGYLGGDVSGTFELNYDASIGACHGVNLALEAGFLAEAEANLKLLWLIKGKAKGDASASLGIKINAEADLNIFNVLGFAAIARAEIQATAGGSLSVNLDFEDIAKAAKNIITQAYAYDIFIAFLNEIYIGAGISGRVIAGASACATVSVRGSLMDDKNAGFEVKADAYAAIGVGAGYGMFAEMKLDNPKRFYLYASERTTQEIVDTLKTILPKEHYYLLEVLQFTLPVVFNSAYELAQHQIDANAEPEEITKAFTNNFLSQLQRYLLDKIVEVGFLKLTDAINGQINIFMQNNDLPGDADATVAALDKIIERLTQDGLNSENINAFITDCIDLFDASGIISEKQQTAITLVWLAFNTVEIIRNGFQQASASAHAGTFVTGQKLVQGIFVELENPPQLVKDELSRLSGKPITTIDTTTAINYIINSQIAEELIEKIPHLSTILTSMQICLGGMTIGEMLEAAFKTDPDTTITQNEIYQRLKIVIKDFIDNLIQDRLITALHDQANDNEDALRYIDEVVQPTCKVMSDFVFDRLDQFINNNGNIDESFKIALTTIITQIISSNVLLVTDILLSHTLENSHTALRKLAHDIENLPDNNIAKASVELFKPLLPANLSGVASDLDEFSSACAELAKNLCLAGADISGPLVYNLEIMNSLKENSKKLFNAFASDPEKPITDGLDVFFQGLADCGNIPNPKAVQEMGLTQLKIIHSSLEILIPQVSDALALFGLRLTETTVARIEKDILKIFEDLDALLDNLNKGLQNLKKEIKKIVEAYENALKDLTNALDNTSDALKSDTSKTFFLLKLKQIGAVRFGHDASVLANYNTVCDVIMQPIINIALDLMAEYVKLNSNIFRYVAGNTIQTDQLFDLIPSTLPAEVALDDVKAAFIELMEDLKPIINHAVEMKAAEIEAKRRKNDIEAEEIIRQQAIETQEKRTKLPEVKNIETEIISPINFVDKKTKIIADWTYGKELPLHLKIKGADITFLTTTPKNIFLAINGKEYSFDFAKWTPEESYLVYDAVLSFDQHPLQQGINVIECTVITSEKVTKTTVECMMNPDLASDCTVVFDMEKSMLDTGGDDHDYRQNESVAFTNTGNMPADMSEWMLSDRKNPVFILPKNVRLMPRETLKIFTGFGTDTTDSLFQKRKRAIWNNTEDTVLLINKDRVLVLNQKYKLK